MRLALEVGRRLAAVCHEGVPCGVKGTLELLGERETG